MRVAVLVLLALLALLSVTLLSVAGCSTGTDAVARGGSFEFVSPGGQTDIFYDPPADRGTVGDLAGESLLEPGTTISLDEYRGRVVVLNVWGSWCGPCRACLLYTSPSPRDRTRSRMPSSA